MKDEIYVPRKQSETRVPPDPAVHQTSGSGRIAKGSTQDGPGPRRGWFCRSQLGGSRRIVVGPISCNGFTNGLGLFRAF